jgi:hypothetical protein
LADASAHTIPSAESAFISANIRSSGLLRRRWLYHLAFWIPYFALLVIFYLSLHMTMTTSLFAIVFFTVVIEAGFSYFNLYVLIPRLLFTRRYLLYVLAFLLAVMACSPTVLLMETAVVRWIAHEPSAAAALWVPKNLIVGVVMGIYVLGLTMGIKFAKDSMIEKESRKEREKHYLETELKFLKSQIQPHFFFNTLNNIYSLTLKQSEQAPEVILKLSDLMSYMLYDSTAPSVPLAKEIAYLHNYVDIEQLRFGNRLQVSFTTDGPIDSAEIPPMILILFLENSFKHGVKNNISQIQLTIDLLVADGYLHFHVENPVSEEEKPVENNGIGLKNVRRRLDLLFGNTYTLTIGEHDRFFIVHLKMPLC